MKFLYSDGGRSNYFEGDVGDCVTRAFSIGLGVDYIKMYETINKLCRKYPQHNSWANNGIYPILIRRLGKHFNLKYVKEKGIVKKKTRGRYIFLLHAHLTYAMNGILMDTHDCSNEEYYAYFKL